MGIIALVTWLIKVPVRGFLGFTGFLAQFRADWLGEPSTAGHPGHPGVMERMQRMDGALGRNGGSSLADKVHANDRTLQALTVEVAKIAGDISAMRAQAPCLHPDIDPCPTTGDTTP